MRNHLYRLWVRAGFRGRQPTVMDALAKLAHGSSPSQNKTNLQEAIVLSYETVLQRTISKAEVRTIATELYNGPMTYSTNDLALATAVNFFLTATGPRREVLRPLQLHVRMVILKWFEEKKINPVLARSFEETLYRNLKRWDVPEDPQIPETQPRPKRMDADTFWRKLRKSTPEDQKKFFETLSGLTTREQRREWLTYTPLWDQLVPLVIEAILDAITDKGLFEAFVLTSMTHDLVAQYEVIGQEEAKKTFIRTRISQILCQSGNKARLSLAQNLKTKANQKNAAQDAVWAEVAFEAAIAMAKDQIVAYEGLSAIYGMSGNRAKCHDYAKRGLAELAETRPLLKKSRVIPPKLSMK